MCVLPVLDHEMILTCKCLTSATKPISRFDGTSNMRKFRFTFKNKLAWDITDSGYAYELMRYLDGAAFDFDYENIAADSKFHESALD